MGWGLAFRLRQHIKGSLWLLPAAGVLVGWVLALVSVQIDQLTSDAGVIWTYAPSTTTSLLSTIVGAMLALTGFVVTVVTLGVQIASGTFSARYMRLWYRDGLLKTLLAFLLGTLSFSFMTIRFVDDTFVPSLTVTLAALAVTICTLLVVFYLDHFLHRLRPVAVAAWVADQGRRAFESWMWVIEGARHDAPTRTELLFLVSSEIAHLEGSDLAVGVLVPGFRS